MVRKGDGGELLKEPCVSKSLLSCFLVQCALIVAVVCAWGESDEDSVLVFGRVADSITLDPARAAEGESFKVLENIYEGLVRYWDDSTDIEPSLAVSWEQSQDGKTWTFHLRKNVVFHDGTPFDAHAVVYNFTRQIDLKDPWFREYFDYASFTFNYVKTVEALDNSTVKITLDRPYAPFLSNLAMSAAKIASPTALEKWGNEFGMHPVGTGPFKFVEWIPKARIVLQKNENYWGTEPFLDRVVFRCIPDNSQRFNEFQNEGIDAMDGINPMDVKKIEKLPDSELLMRPGLNIGYLAMNAEKSPYHLLEVRRAINHAINKINLVKLLYQGMAVPAKTPIPPVLWSYNQDIQDYKYDPQKAKILLEQAGYENGFETTLWVMRTSQPYMPQPLEIARAIQGNLEAVGIKVKIVSHKWDIYKTATENGEHDMGLFGWIGESGDPDSFLYVLLDKGNAVKGKATNVAFFKNHELHALLIRAQQISNREERIRLYGQAQKIIHQKAPWVPLAHAQQILAFKRKVQGIVQHPTGVIRLYKTQIKEGEDDE
jgi:peptide/nickel transport system substrate-binding protein